LKDGSLCRWPQSSKLSGPRSSLHPQNPFYQPPGSESKQSASTQAEPAGHELEQYVPTEAELAGYLDEGQAQDQQGILKKEDDDEKED
jgi:hypothetical protein